MSLNSWDHQIDRHIHNLDEELKGVRAKKGIEPCHQITPLYELAMNEEADADDGYEEGLRDGRAEGVKIMLREVFKDGYHPAASMRRLYALAQLLTPELIAEMSGADCASMFAETRAAWNKRLQALFDETNIRSRAQKRDSSVARMAKAQEGNDNRKQGHLKNTIINNSKPYQN